MNQYHEKDNYDDYENNYEGTDFSFRKYWKETGKDLELPDLDSDYGYLGNGDIYTFDKDNKINGKLYRYYCNFQLRKDIFGEYFKEKKLINWWRSEPYLYDNMIDTGDYTENENELDYEESEKYMKKQNISRKGWSSEFCNGKRFEYQVCYDDGYKLSEPEVNGGVEIRLKLIKTLDAVKNSENKMLVRETGDKLRDSDYEYGNYDIDFKVDKKRDYFDKIELCYFWKRWDCTKKGWGKKQLLELIYGLKKRNKIDNKTTFFLTTRSNCTPKLREYYENMGFEVKYVNTHDEKGRPIGSDNHINSHLKNSYYMECKIKDFLKNCY